MRNILVHYHVFKNAGSTVDRILARHFGARWGSVEAGSPWEILDQARFSDFVLANPALCAVSSHQARLPPPCLDGCRFHALVFLRHPIDRVGSVYGFERSLPAGASPGADKARTTEFGDYVDWRLDEGDGGVICNFQAAFLGWRPGDPDFSRVLSRAARQLDETPCVGLVDRFDESMRRIADYLLPDFGAVDVVHPAANRNSARDGRLEDRIESIRRALGNERYQRLLDMNQLDIALYEDAARRFDQ